jgi:hypothetical protein
MRILKRTHPSLIALMFAGVLCLTLPLEVFAGSKGGSRGSHSVKGYYRKDGTYVAPHQRTNPDSSTSNNWSTKGNVNPYTGKEGTVDPQRKPQPSEDPTTK